MMQGHYQGGGIKNNSEYVTEKKRCYIEAARDIPAYSEILVAYGGEYWQAIRYNIRLEESKKKKGKSSKAILPHQFLKKKSKS